VVGARELRAGLWNQCQKEERQLWKSKLEHDAPRQKAYTKTHMSQKLRFPRENDAGAPQLNNLRAQFDRTALARSKNCLRRNSCSLGGRSLDDLESQLGGFPLELFDL